MQTTYLVCDPKPVPAHLELPGAFLAPLIRDRPDAVVFVAGRFDPDAPPNRADLVVFWQFFDSP